MFNYQLYSSRNFPPLAKTLTMLAEAGYDGVEGYGDLYADSATLLDLAEGMFISGLAMPSGHFDLAQVEQNPNWVVKVARVLGMETVVVPWLEPDQRPRDASEWRALGGAVATGRGADPGRGAEFRLA